MSPDEALSSQRSSNASFSGDRPSSTIDPLTVAAALGSAQGFLSAVLEGITDPIFVKDDRHRYLYFNDAFCQLTGLTREQLLGKSDQDLFLPHEAAEFQAADRLVLQSGEAQIHEESMTDASGMTRIVLAKKTRIQDALGNCYLVCTIQDITALKWREAELEAAIARFDLANQATNEGLWEIGLINGDLNHPDNPVWWSPKFRELLGFRTVTEFPDRVESWSDRIHPDDAEWVTAALLAHIQDATGQTPYDVEYRMFTRTGECRWYRNIGSTLHNENGIPLKVVGTFRDVTDRKHAEEELRRQKHLFKSVLDNIPHRIWLKDRQGRHVVVNQSFAESVGIAPEALIGKTDFDLWPTDKAQMFQDEDQAVMNTGQAFSLEEQLPMPDGTTRWFSTTKTPMYDEAGRVIGTTGISMDVSDRRQAEEALRQAKEELEFRVEERTAELQETVDELQKAVFIRERAEHSLLKTLKELQFRQFAMDQAALIAITDPQGVITYVNDKLCEISGYSEAELVGKTHRIINSGYHPPEFFQQMWATIRSGKVWRGEVKNRAKAGHFYWVSTTIVPALDQNGRVQKYLAIRFDISDRKFAEEALQQSEAQLRQQTDELRTTLWELQRTQSQLIQSEKMSSLGQLVAGVAHEINNPVNFIYGNLNYANEYAEDLLQVVRLYQQHYPDPVPAIQDLLGNTDLDFLLEDMPKLLKSMRVGAERIQKIVVSLRNFSRMDEAEFKAVDLHEGIDNTLMILQNRLKGKPGQPAIEVVREYGSLPKVECYASSLNQVFMNILSNAIDALEDVLDKGEWGDSQNVRASGAAHFPCGNRPDAPTITIRTEYIIPDRVAVYLIDNGPGIPEAVQKRLFDPFFTTKPVGKGTGLGMSISYQIVTERHGGILECSSEPGQGALFRIEIPIRQGTSDGVTG
ncbi:PAS domain S-box protein [Leptolyngbya sp. O-77]|uniref:PAS domain-containing sensor histidine kinase n=1 Tax=Leptolyngbya sp. O-77 TaxID=1080068 RepID=UPI00074D32D2|nr:PAS domain S-box protein [Leptolyngbya sp. O-77]BAU44035.1 Blue-light-activated protein [Leptolyngbya sp. O-77]